jgi:hypothetical protein
MSTPFMSYEELADKFESLHPSPKAPVLGPMVCGLTTGANPSYVVFPEGDAMHIVANGIFHSFTLHHQALQALYDAIGSHLSEREHHAKAMQEYLAQQSEWHDARKQYSNSNGSIDPFAKEGAGQSVEPTK